MACGKTDKRDWKRLTWTKQYSYTEDTHEVEVRIHVSHWAK